MSPSTATSPSRLSRALATVASGPRWALIGIIRLYQLVVSPMLGPRCKYYPSCSSYGLEAVRRHGAMRGFVLAGWRVLRCNPWSHGGVDDVPARGAPLFRRSSSQSSSDASASLSTR